VGMPDCWMREASAIWLGVGEVGGVALSAMVVVYTGGVAL
jgi:hypothetical protein